MSDKTGIEWADSTFNPWMGCTKISPACDHCYAERDTKRFGRVQWGAGQPRVRTSAGNWKNPLLWNAGACWFIQCDDCGWRGESKGALCQHCHSDNTHPARRRVFCASLADVFDNEIDPQWRYDLFSLILSTPSLDWMLLTKRIGNAKRMIEETLPESMKALPVGHPLAWPWAHVWIGATVCNQEEADRDIPKLLAVPAAVRFLSIEPLLGDIDITPHLWGRATPCAECSVDEYCDCGFSTRADLGEPAINWVIVGGESGPNARPMHPDWARTLRDQCSEADVPFLFKQWGEWAPREPYASELMESDELCGKWDGISYRYGKKLAGRLLDGVEHNGYPKGGAA